MISEIRVIVRGSAGGVMSCKGVGGDNGVPGVRGSLMCLLMREIEEVHLLEHRFCWQYITAAVSYAPRPIFLFAAMIDFMVITKTTTVDESLVAPGSLVPLWCQRYDSCSFVRYL